MKHWSVCLQADLSPLKRQSRDRFCPCPNPDEDSHKGCPYEFTLQSGRESEMLKRILFLGLLILVSSAMWKQNSSAEIWERHNTTVHAESLLTAIERGDKIMMSRCRILGPLIKEGTAERTDTIRSYVGIVECAFPSWVSFKYCCFMEQVNFLLDTFMVADFSHSAFVQKCSFNLSSFRSLLFTGTSFGEDADFSGVTFGADAVFHTTEFGQKVHLGLADFGNMYVSWRELKGHIVYDRLCNYRLMKFWIERRQLDDADRVYLFLKDRERMEKPKLQRYLEYWLIQQTCGYGVKPCRTLVTSGLVMILFAIFYYLIEIREPKRALGAGIKRIGMKAWNGVYFSINTFVTGAPLDWAPENTQSSAKHYLFRILTTLERMFGWVLLVLFVVTLTRKFIR